MVVSEFLFDDHLKQTTCPMTMNGGIKKIGTGLSIWPFKFHLQSTNWQTRRLIKVFLFLLFVQLRMKFTLHESTKLVFWVLSVIALTSLLMKTLLVLLYNYDIDKLNNAFEASTTWRNCKWRAMRTFFLFLKVKQLEMWNVYVHVTVTSTQQIMQVPWDKQYFFCFKIKEAFVCTFLNCLLYLHFVHV